MHIDVHTHFFNTRYLPLAGVGHKTKRIPIALARLIAAGITTGTPDDDSLEHDGSWFGREVAASEFALSRHEEPQPLELTPSQAIDRFVETIPERLLGSPEFEAALREAGGARGFLAEPAAPPADLPEHQRREWLRGYLREGGRSALAARAESIAGDDAGSPGIGGYLAFLYNLTCREKTLADHHRRQSLGVGLFVHLMMDMEWPYEDEPKYAFPRAVRRVRQLCRQSGGRIIPFVAFDAYRPDSLDLVTQALLHQSFVGVKFYAPSGYRPRGNSDAVKARTDVSPDELDRRCAALIEWCAERDIPIMAHCTPQGMEVAPRDHSGLNAAPEFWAEWLGKYPDLRLCFAHAGGHGHWFPGDVAADDRPPTYPWAVKIIELCTTRRNVYTDFSHIGEVFADGVPQAFSATLARDVAAHQSAEFPLSGKIMYGTDYPMPLPAGAWQGYYQRVLQTIRAQSGPAEHEDAFFRNNARAFLNLRAFLDNRGADLTAEQVQLLNTYS